MSNTLQTLRDDLKIAADRADGVWERFNVFLHAHPKTAVIVVAAVAFVAGLML